jgi:hypothetical protein
VAWPTDTPAADDGSLANATIDSGASEIYRGVLFHGPLFHAIDRITQVDESGISAAVHPAPWPACWMANPPADGWTTDPLVLDACLQLGIVWCQRHTGSLCLPSYIGRIRQFAPWPDSQMHISVTPVETSAHQLTAQAMVRDISGATIVTLDDVRWTIDASLADAFRRRTAESAARA